MNQASSERFQTEFEFTLPKGYIDQHGICHRHGIMRLAKAGDEILSLADPRAQKNAAYLAFIVLARVVIKLGSLQDIDTKVMEGLFAQDFEYLQRLYETLNGSDDPAAALHDETSESDQEHYRGGMRVVGES